MRGYRRAGFMAAVSGLLGAGALVGLIVAAAPASAGTVTAQCDSQASFDPNCLVKETVSTPLSFELQIVSSPSKLGVQFIWNVNCPVDGTDVNAHGIVDGITPVSYQLTIPVPDPASCEAQASATVANGDEITATIIATTATSPAPSPSPHPHPHPVNGARIRRQMRQHSRNQCGQAHEGRNPHLQRHQPGRDLETPRR